MDCVHQRTWLNSSLEHVANRSLWLYWYLYPYIYHEAEKKDQDQKGVPFSLLMAVGVRSNSSVPKVYPNPYSFVYLPLFPLHRPVHLLVPCQG